MNRVKHFFLIYEKKLFILQPSNFEQLVWYYQPSTRDLLDFKSQRTIIWSWDESNFLPVKILGANLFILWQTAVTFQATIFFSEFFPYFKGASWALSKSQKRSWTAVTNSRLSTGRRKSRSIHGREPRIAWVWKVKYCFWNVLKDSNVFYILPESVMTLAL